MPKKKRTTPKLKRTRDRLRHVQYFYVLGGILLAVVIGGAIFYPSESTDVLSVRDGQARSNADGGTIDIMFPDDDGTSDTELYIEANGGREIEREKRANQKRSGEDRGRELREKAGSKAGELREKAKRRIKLRDKNGRDVQEREDRRESRRAEQLLESVIADGIVNEIETNESNEEIITFREANGRSVYVVKGKKSEKLLGFIPVTISREISISEETGNVVETNTNPLNGLLDALSF